jgi:hypothetical protein
VRDFVKERIDLEREYADKLDKLGKKYQKGLRKSAQSFFGAGTPFKADTPGNDTASVTGSTASNEGYGWHRLAPWLRLPLNM